MKLKCLIVDDEPIARQIVESYCALLPEIEVVESCGDALKAKQALKKSNIDLIFLDINMPVLDGLSFIKTLARPPQVILATAYKEFAHQAFDIAACDYLLKPFSLERFIIAVDKAKEKWQAQNQPVSQEVSITENSTYIRSEGKMYKINFSEVFYAEADGNNVKIVTKSSTIRPAITLANLEELLPASEFIRLHRSFIINKNKITHIEGNTVFLGAVEIPIGANFKEHFLREIGIR